MYKIGDGVFYPMHGAGTIIDIEEKDILGEKVKYYVSKMPGEVTLLIPVNNADSLGIRPLVDEKTADDVLKNIMNHSYEIEENWADRYQDNKKRLKTGDIFETADIYKGLSLRNQDKNLSTTEKKMLLNSKQVLFSEISLVKNEDYYDLINKMDKYLLEEDYVRKNIEGE